MTKGFTLVELAIVITIIGLLIGGVLKGQELLENARMTSTYTRYQGFSTATVTFRDIYKALPGDMQNPANFIEGCMASPCNISGDNNGRIGDDSGWGVSNENNTYWLHLYNAKLISGINPAATWTTATWFGPTAPAPDSPLGERMQIIYLSPVNWNVIASPAGHYWHMFATNAVTPSMKCRTIAKYDLKTDDGRPKTGNVLRHPSTPASAPTADNYDVNSTEMCSFIIRAEF